jgi:hypothetical protein
MVGAQVKRGVVLCGGNEYGYDRGWGKGEGSTLVSPP